MTIATGNWGKALWPGVNAWWGDAYNKYDPLWQHMFDQHSSRKAREEDVGTSYFGLAQVTTEGAPVSYQDAQQGFIDRYENTTYTLGFVITREMFEDDLYEVIAQKRAQALAFSMTSTKETIAAGIYNDAFDSNVTYGDGKELIATDHPNIAGSTYSNELSPAADLSETALEDMIIQIRKQKNDAGLRINLTPQTLIVPPDLEWDAMRILRSDLQNDTANNAVNALKASGSFPGGIVVNPYLSDTDAWFIRTDAPDGMKMFQRTAMEFTQDNEFDSDNLKYKARERYSFGASDKRGIFGSPGA